MYLSCRRQCVPPRASRAPDHAPRVPDGCGLSERRLHTGARWRRWRALESARAAAGARSWRRGGGRPTRTSSAVPRDSSKTKYHHAHTRERIVACAQSKHHKQNTVHTAPLDGSDVQLHWREPRGVVAGSREKAAHGTPPATAHTGPLRLCAPRPASLHRAAPTAPGWPIRVAAVIPARCCPLPCCLALLFSCSRVSSVGGWLPAAHSAGRPTAPSARLSPSAAGAVAQPRLEPSAAPRAVGHPS